MSLRFSLVFLLVGPAFFLAGCGDSTSGPTPSRLVVSPGNVTLEALEATQQLSAVLEDQDGRPLEGVTFDWSVTNPQVASVSASGLVTALGTGETTIRASAQGLTGSASLEVDPVPRVVAKVAGDTQTGAMSQLLPLAPTVEMRDANDFPVVGIEVTFTVVAGEGAVSPRQVTTGADGRASTQWTLGCSDANPQRLRADYGGLTTEFTAVADLSLPAICLESVPEGRADLPYSTTLTSAGGDQGTLVWSVAAGALPNGLNLRADGLLAGTPTESGSFAFTVRVQDGQGAGATREYPLLICDAPLDLQPGGATSFSAASNGQCGFFLPAGNAGDRYRIGVMYASTESDDPTDLSSLTLSVTNVLDPMASAAGVPQAVPFWAPERGSSSSVQAVQLPPSFQEALAQADAQLAFQARMREKENILLESLGPQARPLPDLRGLQRVSGPELAAPEKLQIRTPADFTSCNLGSTTTAVKVGENDHLVIYQDSAQNAASPLGGSYVTLMLEHFEKYGKPVIDTYFGGSPDTNGDGQIALLVTPVVDEEEGIAFVWTGDMYSRSLCAASNEMELMRFSLSFIQGIGTGNYQAITTVVHEAQHISAHYQRIQSGQSLQPLWIGEGTAEIAAEVSGRLAWEAAGGPAVGERVEGSDITGITQENYRALLSMFRTARYLSSQPNGLTITPQGASSTAMEYGSGWHFHRWLGDAYGNASTPLADAAVFLAQNNAAAPTGPQGILNITGKSSFAELMGEYASAIMLNGTGAPQGALGFTTYDFVSLNQSFNYNQKPQGDYPWPVNTFGTGASTPFSTVSYSGSLGPGGLRVYDFTSTGTGLGIEVHGSGSRGPLQISVVRIQ